MRIIKSANWAEQIFLSKTFRTSTILPGLRMAKKLSHIKKLKPRNASSAVLLKGNKSNAVINNKPTHIKNSSYVSVPTRTKKLCQPKPFLTNNIRSSLTNDVTKNEELNQTELSKSPSRNNNTLIDSFREPIVKEAQFQSKTLSKYQERLAKHLNGGRFRMLNEELYSNSGATIFKKFQENPMLFHEYHEGYRLQTKSWKQNPTDLIIKWLQTKIAKSMKVADLGCGDARIAKTFLDRKIYSFDLQAIDPAFVTAANIADLPLESAIVDVCIFCLSLMGVDWPQFVAEATRILKKSGILKIAEVQSRVQNPKQFVSAVEAMGYKKMKQENIDTYFFIFEFKKIKTISTIPLPCDTLLLPCIYKKR